uniref:RelE toxin of RelE / RelB toxin-antitoxin system n=1 Tax=Candidatus Kentrum sp. LPFa TaxID=2126335 RepID=A0A450W8Y0_9GAMM|nr:MAG: hypothetical protein BECKLPF1236B_GA0070989_104710 [Candidatus Kentron sp. LPFa]
MRIFKSKEFIRFARKENISDTKLCKAMRDAADGRIDADYGGGVIKQRVARTNEGKSGGYRMVILYRQGNNAFFVHGFAKSDKGNLNKAEEHLYKAAARVILAFSDNELRQHVAKGVFKETMCDDEQIQE